MRTWLALFLLYLLPLCVTAQNNLPGRSRGAAAELQRNALKNNAKPAVGTAPFMLDTLLTPEVPFAPMAVSMLGYTKRINDGHESFILRNNTRNYRISRVLIKLKYIATEDNIVFHNREELIDCDIPPESTLMINIKSFDKSHSYYHHSVPPARATGIPYEVQYDILRYDIVVE